jgi:hypothetical protein
MNEIRLAWSTPGRIGLSGEPIRHGAWIYADAQARLDLQFSAEVGNQAFGLGTHWIEQREARTFKALHSVQWTPPRRPAVRPPSRHERWLPPGA